MNDFIPTLIRIGKIAAVYYTRQNPSQTLIIYGMGAPNVPDNGSLSDAPFIMPYDADILVPDYLGFARSDSVFTPKNSIKTFLTLYQNITQGCIGTNFYLKKDFHLKYSRIIFVGKSFGGTYVPLLPRFNKNITELAVLYPALDNPSSGLVKGEESNEDFMRAMEKDGFKYLYRGILSKSWWLHLRGEDDLLPKDNIKYLKNAKLFIGHGKKDSCINYSKSVKFFELLTKTFPDKKSDFKLALYPQGEHGSTTSNLAIGDILDWFEVKKLRIK